MRVAISLTKGYVTPDGRSIGVSPGIIKVIEVKDEDFARESNVTVDSDIVETEIIVTDVNGTEYSVFDYKIV